VRLKYPADDEKVARLSIVDETGDKYVRMAHLATIGSHAVNGVAELHSELLKRDVLRDFYEFWPAKFHNITNGVTPRRWIVLSNPRLSWLITQKLGERWIKNFEELRRLEPFADDGQFAKRWRLVKRENKSALAVIIKERTGTVISPDSMFDIQVKRIHEYKRQHLKVFHIITLYNRIKHDRAVEIAPRSFIFGGKAAPGYFMAKLIIKLINSVGEVVNNDPDVRGRLKIAFLPNFNVQSGQKVYPAADLSEQISTAGKEASGTGNMKFSMNGALTIGTLDGANIEIRQEAGAENFFLFGLTAEEVFDMKARGYDPRGYYESNANLQEIIDQIKLGYFSKGDRNLFKPLVDSLLDRDEYMLLADYQSYIDCQDRAGKVFLDGNRWTRMSILNVARMGRFSSDRSIREYCEKIWNAEQVEYDE
jgi:starch phosphorylase